MKRMNQWVWVVLVVLASVAQAADRKALVVKDGVLTEQPAADVLDAGAGVKGTGALTVNGVAGVSLQNNGTTNLSVGSGTVIVATGVELETTGTGMIDLPAQFKIANTQVSADVTAGNLGAVTGSGITTLHKHETEVIGSLTTTGCSAGQVVYVSGENTVLPADNTDAAKAIVVGVFAGTSGQIVDTGVVDGVLVKAGDTCTPGVWVYVAETANAGKVTTTAPVAGGTFQSPVGVCFKDNGNSTARIKLLIGTVKANT